MSMSQALVGGACPQALAVQCQASEKRSIGGLHQAQHECEGIVEVAALVHRWASWSQSTSAHSSTHQRHERQRASGKAKRTFASASM